MPVKSLLAHMSFVLPRLVIALFFVGLLIGCTRPPELIGIDNAVTPAASVTTATKRKIFIVTTVHVLFVAL